MKSAWMRFTFGIALLPLFSCVSPDVSERRPASSDEFKTKFVSVASLSSICKQTTAKVQDPELEQIDLNSPEDRKALRIEVEKLDAWVTERLNAAAEDGAAAKVRRQCRPSKKVRTGLKEMMRLMDQSSEDSRSNLAMIAESVTTNFRYPVPRKIESLLSPGVLADRFTNYVGDGNRGPAVNPNPQSSTLWTRQNDISKKDLYFGFNREALSLKSETVCSYDEAKSGYGTRPGFDMKCAKTKFKIRFGPEVNASPFATRIFWALGFNVPVFDYVASPKIAYDRRMLTEFNTRADMTLDITAFGIKVYKYQFQKHFDPLDYVEEAILKDGSHLKAKDLKARLYKKSRISKPELATNNFQEDFEAQIDHLTLKEAGVSPKAKGEDEIGGWDWNSLDYSSRREFRGAGLLAAWVNWYDDRWDNNKLILIEDENGPRLKHAITDLGSSLGNARGVGFYTVGDANGFPWGFIEPRTLTSSSGNIGLVRNYSGFDSNESFLNLDTEDAKWMTRQIAQLTEEQIKQALISAGFSAAETKMFLEKLLYRRDSLVRVYGLTSEFPLLRPNMDPSHFRFDWSPARDSMQAAAKGALVIAPDKGIVIRKGVVCETKSVTKGVCKKPLPPRH